MANSIRLPNFYVDEDGIIKTGRGWLAEVTVRNNAASAGVVVLYDNTAASGTVVDSIEVPANSTLQLVYQAGSGDPGRPFKTGLYADIAASMTLNGRLA